MLGLFASDMNECMSSNSLAWYVMFSRHDSTYRHVDFAIGDVIHDTSREPKLVHDELTND